MNVEFDQSSREESQDKYDPAVSAVLTSQKAHEQTGAGAGAAGIAGTSANLPANTPGAVAQDATATGDDGAQMSSSENATFGVNKTVLHMVTPAGRIRRLTAAILVNDLQEHKQVKGKWVAVPRKPTTAQLQQLQQLAQSVLGADTQRGDVVTVQNMSFSTDASAESPASLADRLRSGLTDYGTPLRYAAMLLLFVLVWALMIRPVQKQLLAGMKELKPGEAAPALTAGAAAAPELAVAMASAALPSAEEPEMTAAKRKLAELVESEAGRDDTHAAGVAAGGHRVMSATADTAELTLSGIRKAAILLTVLGEDTAAILMRSLPDETLQRVMREIATLGLVPAEVSAEVVREFEQMAGARDSFAEGGHATANRLLVKAFGESGAKNLQHQMVRVEELSAGRAESLQKAEPKQLARLLEGEHPQTVALVLGQLEPKQAAALLAHLPRVTRAESVRRLANLRQFFPGHCRAHFSRGPSPFAVGRRDQQADLFGLPECGGADEQRGRGNFARDPGEHRAKGCEARREHTRADVYVRGLCASG